MNLFLSGKIAMDELGPLIYGNYEDCLLYYSRKGLLAGQASCNLRVCGAQMDLKRRPSLKDHFSWRCTNGNCRTWLTIRHGIGVGAVPAGQAMA